MRRRVAAASLAALTLLSTVGVAAAQAAPGRGSDHGRPDAAERAHQRAVDYWTPERMRAAQPKDLELARHGRGDDRPGRSDAPDVTGDVWPDSEAPVARTAGRVFFTQGGGNYTCSATAVDSGDPGVDLLLTAGHCVWDYVPVAEDEKPRQEFPSYFVFVPNGYAGDWRPPAPPADYDDVWSAEAFFTTRHWYKKADLADDTALVTMRNGATTFAEEYGDALPSIAVPTWRELRVGETASAFGYPGGGGTLGYCQGTVERDTPVRRTLGLTCDLTSGASGGPWYSEPNGEGQIVSVNSYLAPNDDRVFGPVFDGPEMVMLRSARDGECDRREVCGPPQVS